MDPVAGNCPSAFAPDSVKTIDAVPVAGPVRVLDHVPANDGMYWVWTLDEARAHVPPAITAVPLPTWAPVLLVRIGWRVSVAAPPAKLPDVSVKTPLLIEPAKGISCPFETHTVPGLVYRKTPVTLVP